ncbi:tubulin--tyrosine ligase-like protein 12 isoform X1 [Haemorhous mexicanus]|uniref:tubulin--tyrosine ligase-like protein 12 isoform X1 n=2 Tax=Haemorhous mexicanus TaxID=30427 RepID=UPI0028BD8325|nr:tubulin--tyrosine ligase-like protein 12 isoform X1 [Haemorhous mexicanus]
MAGEGEEALAAFVALHGAALRASRVPTQYWESLSRKLRGEIFDAGDYFGIMQVEEVEEEEVDEEMEEHFKKKPNPGNGPCFKVIVTNENGLQASNPNSVFLIDHAWTYRVEHARHQLRHVPGLLHRMASLMGIPFHGELPDEGSIELVLQEMWKYSQTYQLSQGTAEEKVPVWYIMDEFGSRIQHSDQPSFAAAPLFYMPQQIAYTVLWPLRDLETGDEVTRDYAYGEMDRLIRKCVLLPWVPTEVLDVSSSTPEPPDEHYQAILAENKEKLPVAINPPVYAKDKIFKVFTDIQQVLNNLTHPRFVFTDNEGEADILYNFSHFKDYRKLSEERPEVMVNQFPCENLLTVKDCLASIARRAGGPDGPTWLPRTFNLQTELPQFISCFQQRDRRGEDNHWICKPWNLARSLDTHITNNLNSIIRHRESSPKVVCKYIEEPVLFEREDVGLVKFDVRYVVLLCSARPLRLYSYDVFWLRFSNRAFSLDDLDDYEKHFTVMNYAPGVTLKQVHCEDFIPLFEKQYPEYPWATVQASIFKAFAELFQVATSKPAPLGICDYPSSRAIYAIDLMLKWDTSRDGKRIMQPQILEVNFNPDCDRACKYHPTFFNDVFSTLFLDEADNCHVTRIV